MTDRLALAVAELAAAIRADVQVAAAGPVPPERLLSIPEAAASLGLSRTATYGELQAGRLRSLKVGRRRLIPAHAIGEFIAAKSNGRAATTLPDRSNQEGVREPLPTG